MDMVKTGWRLSMGGVLKFIFTMRVWFLEKLNFLKTTFDANVYIIWDDRVYKVLQKKTLKTLLKP